MTLLSLMSFIDQFSMYVLVKLIITALSLVAVAALLPGITVSSTYIAFIVAIILGLLNLFIRPILLILTLPITIVTLGLFTFVLNGFLFWFVSTFVEGFEVHGFFAAVFGAIFVSVFSFIGNKIIEGMKESHHTDNSLTYHD